MVELGSESVCAYDCWDAYVRVDWEATSSPPTEESTIGMVLTAFYEGLYGSFWQEARVFFRTGRDSHPYGVIDASGEDTENPVIDDGDITFFRSGEELLAYLKRLEGLLMAHPNRGNADEEILRIRKVLKEENNA
jgi:hypothetical protein